MKAPSEKHLEDWIIKNSSQFKPSSNSDGYSLMELYLHQVYQIDVYNNNPYADSIFLRQVELSSGKPDLIGIRDNHIVVIELKKDSINERCLIQLAKYVRELQYMAMHREIGIIEDFHKKPYVNLDRKIFGIAVGYGKPNKQTIWGCPRETSLISYEYNDDGNYTFKAVDFEPDYNWNVKGGIAQTPVLSLVDHVIIKAHEESDKGGAV